MTLQSKHERNPQYMKRVIPLAVALLASAPIAANATLTWNATPGGTSDHPSVSFLDFAGALPAGVALSFSGSDSGLQTGSTATHAAPYGDVTQYVSTGLGSATLTFAAPQEYVGLQWGSADQYNTFQLYEGATLVGALTGGQIDPGANGDRGQAGTFYVNVSSDVPFDRMAASSTNYAFEYDTVATVTPAGVPEPASLALFGGGLLGLGWVMTRRPANYEARR